MSFSPGHEIITPHEQKSLIYAYGIQNALSGKLQLFYLLMDFKSTWHTCQNAVLHARPRQSR